MRVRNYLFPDGVNKPVRALARLREMILPGLADKRVKLLRLRDRGDGWQMCTGYVDVDRDGNVSRPVLGGDAAWEVPEDVMKRIAFNAVLRGNYVPVLGGIAKFLPI